MTKKEAKKVVSNLIKNGYVICEEDGTEWLWDGADLFVWMDENGDWSDWPVGVDGIKEKEMQTPDDVGKWNKTRVRLCKNQDCGNPFDASDLELVEVLEGNFRIGVA